MFMEGEEGMLWDLNMISEVDIKTINILKKQSHSAQLKFLSPVLQGKPHV